MDYGHAYTSSRTCNLYCATGILVFARGSWSTEALKAIEEMDGVKFQVLQTSHQVLSDFCRFDRELHAPVLHVQGKNLNIQLSMGKGGGLLNIFHLQLHKRNSLILEQVVVHSLPRVAQGQKLYLLRNLDERGAS